MKKFIFFTASINRKSGGSSSILDLSSNISNLGRDVEIYSILGKLDLFIYKPTSFNKSVKVKIQDFNIVNSLENKPHIIKQKINFILSKFSKSSNIKNSIIFDALKLPSSYIKKLQESNNKVVLNHAGSPNSFIKYFGTNGNERSNYVKAKKEYLEYVSRYDYFWFQSKTQASEFLELTNFEQNRVIVLTPGANEDDIAKAKYINLGSNFNISIIGSIHKRKGQHYLIEIAQKIPEATFHIVGKVANNSYYNNMQELIKNNSIKNIIFHGFKSNYLDYIKSSNLILQLSEEEGVSRILREAMALQKPIVAFDLEGTQDLLENGNDSLLVEYANIDKIIQSIKNIQNNKELRENISKSAKNNFLNKYSNSVYLSKLNDILRLFDE